jgi:hypothetical protein
VTKAQLLIDATRGLGWSGLRSGYTNWPGFSDLSLQGRVRKKRSNQYRLLWLGCDPDSSLGQLKPDASGPSKFHFLYRRWIEPLFKSPLLKLRDAVAARVVGLAVAFAGCFDSWGSWTDRANNPGPGCSAADLGVAG